MDMTLDIKCFPLIITNPPVNFSLNLSWDCSVYQFAIGFPWNFAAECPRNLPTSLPWTPSLTRPWHHSAFQSGSRLLVWITPFIGSSDTALRNYGPHLDIGIFSFKSLQTEQSIIGSGNNIYPVWFCSHPMWLAIMSVESDTATVIVSDLSTHLYHVLVTAGLLTVSGLSAINQSIKVYWEQ